MEILTAAQMRSIETTAMESGRVTSAQLMARAGYAVLEVSFRHFPQLIEGVGMRATVLCGPGNNGGDGLLIAETLAARDWDVTAFIYGRTDSPHAPIYNVETWNASRVAEHLSADDSALVIDALFGIGLSRPLAPDLTDAWRDCNPRAKYVAVDMPSGLCSDSGQRLSAPLPIDLTVTFHRAKIGHYLLPAAELCGALEIADIGLPDAPAEATRLYTPQVSELKKHPNAHKYDYGHALILSGGAGQTGAARLAARGALRVGAGLVTLGVPPQAMAEASAQLTAIMLRPIADASALAKCLEDKRINALCLGPALGLDSNASDLLAKALEMTAPVLDADALTLLSESPALFDALPADAILTPHSGEFARLFPDIDAPSKCDATRKAAKKAGCVVVHKGADTVIADADGRCVICPALYDRRAPWLATAGAGDVLAGFITGLRARGFSAFDAAALGVWLHIECGRVLGAGLIATDIADALPRILKAKDASLR